MYINKNLTNTLHQFLLEVNDRHTRNCIVSCVNTFFLDLQARGALYDFKIICDDTNNTPSRIKQNSLFCDVYIRPINSLEFIHIRGYVGYDTINFDMEVLKKERFYSAYDRAMEILGGW